LLLSEVEIMKRENQRMLELIFHRPVSAKVRWDDIEALFVELVRRLNRIVPALVSQWCCSTKCVFFTVRIQARIQTKARLQQ
jgi:hypothetical protein